MSYFNQNIKSIIFQPFEIVLADQRLPSNFDRVRANGLRLLDGLEHQVQLGHGHTVAFTKPFWNEPFKFMP